MPNAFGFFLKFGKKVFSAGHSRCVYLYLWCLVGSVPQIAKINCTSGFLTHKSERGATVVQQAAELQLLREQDITLIADVSNLQVFNTSR